MGDSSGPLQAALAGRYRLDRQLGEGGMATVYLAEDTRHHRRVALKVLRPELAAVLGAERFLKEIEVTAGLQHPHILPLFDSGAFAEHDGEAGRRPYYVMPYVEGESLRDRLRREKQLPIAEAVRIATEVAGALDYAHRRGVVHRDIKPENILLHDGSAVVADFGIALAMQQAGGSRLTETGLSLGTPQYMSPEQAAGDRELDARSDVYALGCVLYEMLAGDPPYTGSTLNAVTARKLSEPVPPIRTVRETVPLELEQVVVRALAKLPADRFATAAELAAALTAAGGLVATPSTPVPSFAPVAEPRWKRFIPWAIALAATGMAAALAVGGGAEQAGNLRLSANTPKGTEAYGFGASAAIALSPDGSTLVFAAGRNDSVRLYARRLDSFEVRPLPGTEGGDSPFFSPDGRWVGFFDRGKRELRKVPLAGGTPSTIVGDLGSWPQAGVWGPADTIYFANSPDLQISKVAAGGGPIGKVTSGNPPGGWFRAPLALLPDGRHLLTLVAGGLPAQNHLDAVSLESGEHQLLLRGAQAGLVVDGHYLVYLPADQPEVRAVAFDAKRLAVSGDPVAVLDSVARDPLEVVVSSNGTLAYVPLVRWIDPGTQVQLALVGRDGKVAPRKLPGGGGPRFSPDGRQLVYVTTDRNGPHVAVYDLGRGAERQFRYEGQQMWPIFSHDGARIVFNASPLKSGGYLLLNWAAADGSGRPERLPTDTINHQQPFTWAAGGRELLYTEGPNTAGDMDLWVAPIDGSGATHPLMNSRANETQPAVSPDGRWLAWMTDASGRPEVMVRRYPDGPDVPVSREGGVEPAWSGDGREIYFRDVGATSMMVASFEPGDIPLVGAPRVLFAGRFLKCYIWCRSYDVSPDGRWFVVESPVEGFTETGYWPSGSEIRIVTHWDREVEQRMKAAAR